MELKALILFLLNGEEVIIIDDCNKHFQVKLEKMPDGVDYEGDITLLIHSERLGTLDT